MSVQRPDIAHSLRQRELDRQRAGELAASVTPTTGFVTLDGPGQALHDLSFPVAYTEKPSLAPSYDLAEGQQLDPENFPTLSVGVHFYNFVEPQPGTFLYTGARLIIVATGHDGMVMNVHYRFEGVALTNPINPQVVL